jgi:uroporphyrin-III C-methyltransferase
MDVTPRPGTVSLVGAGPGDPDLLTVAGLRCLQAAEVVVYDRLVGSGVLALAPPGCERVYVGKRKHLHVLAQEQIHELLIERARRGLRVVRLKGGDGLVFGRVGEELDALDRAGISWQVIPGITAAQGAAAMAGLPLTHRDDAQALTLVTAHRRHGGLELDWDLVMRPAQTVVFYMGLSLLDEIVSGLLARGKSPDTSFTIISRATLPDERRLTTRLDRVTQEAESARMESPALLIMGPRPRRDLELDFGRIEWACSL